MEGVVIKKDIIDEDSGNPRLQCSVCGQWKRLTLKDGMQTFYPCCGENGEHEHLKNVCDECCKKKCPYRTMPKDTVIIYYIWWAKGHGIQKNWYCAELNGEVLDYHTKSTLKKNAVDKGLPWQVIRHHKDGRISVIEKSS